MPSWNIPRNRVLRHDNHIIITYVIMLCASHYTQWLYQYKLRKLPTHYQQPLRWFLRKSATNRTRTRNCKCGGRADSNWVPSCQAETYHGIECCATITTSLSHMSLCCVLHIIHSDCTNPSCENYQPITSRLSVDSCEKVLPTGLELEISDVTLKHATDYTTRPHWPCIC